MGARQLVTGCAQRLANDPFRDARNSRRLGAHGVQPLATRPQERAVGTLDHTSPRIQNHRLVGTERLRRGAQGGESFEIGALDGGYAPRVVGRRRQHRAGRERRARAHEQPGIAPFAQFDAGKQGGARMRVAARRDRRARVGHERLEVDRCTACRAHLGPAIAQRRGAAQKPGEVMLDTAGTTADDAKRVGDENLADRRVAPAELGERRIGAGRVGSPAQRDTGWRGRDAHTLQRMAARGGRLRVQRIALGPLGELEALAARVHAEPHAFALGGDARGSVTRNDWGLAWLDSGRAATAGRSVLAVGRAVELRRGSVLIDARAALDAMRARTDEQLPSPLGLIGWFGYELRDETMGAPVPSVPDAHRASWMLVDSALVVDHATGLAELVAVGKDDDVADWVARMRAAIDAVEPAAGDDARDERRGATAEAAEPARTARTAGMVRWRDTDEHYAELVRQCLAAIREGDAYQLCLTTQATVETVDDPVTLYRRVRASSPAHHGALITLGGVSLVSASPETFLTVRDGVVTTRPIKGTRRRDPDSERDAALARELAADEKERAENLMIVDLMRNDLQRVCAIGSVTVTGLHEVESYRHVHQLVSTVSGRLRPGLDVLDAVEATFPAGSMTGAPKRRAVELLSAFEAAPRGIYSGAFGMLGASGDADLAMVIRSIVVADGVATVGAGGGITALSVPEREVAEMHVKAAALLAALGVDEAARGADAPASRVI